MLRRPPRSTLFPSRRSSDLAERVRGGERREGRERGGRDRGGPGGGRDRDRDRKSTRLNSSHVKISYAVFCLKKKKTRRTRSAVALSGAPWAVTRLNRGSRLA